MGKRLPWCRRCTEAFEVLINREMIANEIVRSLVGSIGLVSAVPITTALAVSLCRRQKARTAD